MATVLPCPACRESITLPATNGELPDRVSCAACGATFRIKGKPKAKGSDAGTKAEQPPRAEAAPSVPTPVAEVQPPVEAVVNGTPEADDVDQAGADLPSDEVESTADEAEATESYGFQDGRDWSTVGEDDVYKLASDGEDVGSATDDHSEYGEPVGPVVRKKKKSKSSDSVGEVGKKSKKSKKGKSSSGGVTSNQPLMIGAAGAGIVVILLAVWAFLPNRPAKGPQPNVADGKAPEGEGAPEKLAAKKDVSGIRVSGRPVTLNQPVVGVQPDPPKEDPLAAVRPKEFTLTFAPIKSDPMANKDAEVAGANAGDAESKTPEPVPLWQTTPDPRPADANYVIAPDIKLELTGVGTHLGNFNDSYEHDGKPKIIFPSLLDYKGWYDSRGQIPPILAAQQGPYAIVAPVWEKAPYAWKLIPNKPGQKYWWKSYQIVEYETEDLPVIDLRTGQPAGKFSWKIPFWLQPVLSPNGETLVGPFHELPVPDMGLPPVSEEIKQSRRALHVWKRDSKDPPKPLPMNGEVSSVTFADNQTLVVLVERPQRKLEIWDTAEAKLTGSVDLPHELKYEPQADKSKDPLDLQSYPPATPNVLAVSPGGKHAAVMSSAGVMVVALSDAKLLGTVPLDDPAADTSVLTKREAGKLLVLAKFDGTATGCFGLEFAPEGDSLLTVSRSVGGGVALQETDVATGVVRRRRPYGGEARGPAVFSPTRDSFALIDYPPLNRGFSDTRFFDLDKPQADPQFKPYTIVRFPNEGPLLAVRQPGDRRPDSPMVPTLASVSRDAYLSEVQPMLEVDELGFQKRPRAIVADRSGAVRIDAQPPAEWTVPPEYASPKSPPVAELGAAWPHAFGGPRAIVIKEEPNRPSTLGHRGQPVSATLLDLTAKTAATGAPVEVFAYGYRPNQNTSGFNLAVVSGIPTALSRDGQQFAVADPDNKGRIEVWSAEGQRQAAFLTANSPQSRVSWLGYTGDGRLMTLQDGELVAWTVGDQEIKATYESRGDYRLPMEFAPDGTVLAASRGKSVDLVNPLDGKVWARLSTEVEGEVVDVAFCPDGHRVAVLYETEKEWIKAKTLRVSPYNPGPPKGTIILWDLKTGEGRASPVETLNVSQLGWIGNEHLLLLGAGITVYDLKLERSVLTYGVGAVRGPDGRVWYYDTPTRDSGTWKLPSVVTDPTPDEKVYFTADREMLKLQSKPIQVEIDIGDAALGRTRGEMALRGLQRRGWKIGSGGNVMKITMEIIDTNEEITFQRGITVKIPTIWYSWKLFDDRGREVAMSHTRGAWNSRQSKYVTKPDYETRVRTGADGYFDFKGKDPRSAIIEETLQNPMGFNEAPEFPTELLRIGDKYSKTSEKKSASTGK